MWYLITWRGHAPKSVLENHMYTCNDPLSVLSKVWVHVLTVIVICLSNNCNSTSYYRHQSITFIKSHNCGVDRYCNWAFTMSSMHTCTVAHSSSRFSVSLWNFVIPCSIEYCMNKWRFQCCNEKKISQRTGSSKDIMAFHWMVHQLSNNAPCMHSIVHSHWIWPIGLLNHVLLNVH